MDRDEVEVHKNAKRELGQYPGILTSRLVNNIYIKFVTKKRSKSFVNVLYKSLIEALVRYLLLSSCVQQGLKGI